MALSIASASPAALAAQVTQTGGFKGPGLEPVSVVQAKELRDDTPVTMRGHIIRHLGGEMYMFKDESGEMAVEIDAECWRGQQVGPEDLVEIRGEVDRDFTSLEIDVDQLVKL